MSVEQALQDWISIFNAHDEKYGDEVRAVFELQPSELTRLHNDLSWALVRLQQQTQQLEQLGALVKRYDSALERTMELAQGYKTLSVKTADIAKRAMNTAQDDGYTTRPVRPADLLEEEETLAEFSRRA